MTDLVDIGVMADSTPITKLSAELERTLKSYNKLDAAMNSNKLTAQQYAAAVQQVDSKIDNLKARIEKSAQSTQTFGNALQQSQDKSRRFGLVTQQAGYQMGDFIVQVQSGTNAFVAFGQQATQMVGFLPQMAQELGLTSGAAATWMLGLSIAVPLLTAVGAAIMRTSGSFELGKATATSYSDVIKGLTEDIKKNQEEFLKAKYGTDNQNVADARKNIQDFSKELDDINKKLAGGQVQNFGAAVGTGLAQDTSARRKVELEDTITYLKNQERSVWIVNGGLAQAGDLQAIWSMKQRESIRAQEELNGLIANASQKAMWDANQDIANKQEEIKLQGLILQYGKDSVQVANEKAEWASISVEQSLKEKFAKDGISKAEQQIIDLASAQAYQYETNAGLIDRQTQGAQNLAAAMRDVSAAMKGLLSFSDGLDKALDEANIKVNLLKSGVKASVAGTVAGMQAQLDQKMDAANKAGINPSILSGMFGGEQAKIDALTSSLSEAEKLSSAQSKHGGGPSTSTVENKLKDLYKYLDATQQVNKYLIDEEDIAYKQREDLLKSALDKKLITLQDYQSMEVDLTRRHQQELKAIETARLQTQLADAGNFFGAMASIAESGGKKSAKAVATFQAIEGTVNAYGAALKALNTPGITIWGRFAAYASVLAVGLKGVAAIRSAGGVGGGGGGGSVGSVGTAAATQQATPQQVLIQGMKPTDIFTGEQLSTLFDSLYKENRNRGMVFMVQR
jgi:predicted CopG family antitoxin